jgi:hypothetical protein
MLTHIYIFLACFSVTAWAKVYEHVIDLPGLDYDFVIVGGSMTFAHNFFVHIDMASQEEQPEMSLQIA